MNYSALKKPISNSHLYNSQWPEAVPDCMICKNESDFDARALIISEWAGNRSPILDFGCKDFKIVKVLNRQSIISVGCKSLDHLSDKHKQFFNTILLYDVIDHFEGDRIFLLKNLKNYLTMQGRIKIRCHPWCSRHGGHQVNQHNKAFAHLVYPENWPVEKNIDPIGYYENAFKISGLKILNKISYRRIIEDWILKHFASSIFSYWPHNMWENQDCPQIIPYLELEYIDYELEPL